MTFQEIINYCRDNEKHRMILFRVVITTNLGDFDHILRPKYYEWAHKEGGALEDKALINIRCDFIAYTRKLGMDKKFSLNDGDFETPNRKCLISVADPSDLALYVNHFISDEGKKILSKL